MVEIGTIFVKIDTIAISRPVMQGGEEVGEGGELAIEDILLPMKERIGDDVA